MDGLPWFLTALGGMCFGIFVGFIIGLCAMKKLNEYEKAAKKK